ncbi:hypothetical protein EKH77_31280 [Streptomyces luteoverticillatus]|uniref:DUF4241 domain-containing protein n=1 Tax=Streptomyces luteoverticillatus TaxID=66425 RepID=A0A3Q9G156_STRLT|nr:hypothetical protein [Streptomyces luteoverticillatus]AZQ75043.1 hypothetical protein EKH77_31280 [Streptomyces luteoverticillatus]
MSYDDDEYEYLPALSAVLADPSEAEGTVDGWRIERLGLIQGVAANGTIYDPLGPEGGGFPMRPGGTPVYLVSREDAPGVPVAVLVHPGETVPVRTQEWGDRVATPSGLAVVHANPSSTWIEPGAGILKRAWATLHARAAGGDDWMLENLREMLQRASVDPADWPVEPVEGDFTNDWLMIPDEAGTGTVLGVLVSPDGSNTTECLDAEGNTVAILLTFD